MAQRPVISATIIFRTGPAKEWEAKNPILRHGEPGLATGEGNFKVGDGVTPWNDLEYFIDSNDVIPGDDTAALEAIQAHVNSSTPHSVYDDGPSLLLLYQNAKV